MSDLIITIKNLFVSVVLAVWAFIAPIHDFMVAMMILFIVNFFCGLIADIAHKKSFSFKKAWESVAHASMFFALCLFIFLMGIYIHNPEGAMQTVTYAVYMIIYFYSTNILRNLSSSIHRETVAWKIIDFFYYCLSFKFIEKSKWLREYTERQKNNENENKRTGQGTD